MMCKKRIIFSFQNTVLTFYNKYNNFFTIPFFQCSFGGSVFRCRYSETPLAVSQMKFSIMFYWQLNKLKNITYVRVSIYDVSYIIYTTYTYPCICHK